MPVKYSLWLAIMFAFCPTLVSEQVFEHHETVAESATASSFEQKLDRRVKRFDTAGRTLVASIVDLAFRYQLPTAIEYADREATTRRLNSHFQNESVRRILISPSLQLPVLSLCLRHLRFLPCCGSQSRAPLRTAGSRITIHKAPNQWQWLPGSP